MSSIVPIVFRASSTVPGLAPGPGLAAVSTVGYAGFLVGPPLIGGIAELVGLPTALGVLVLLAATVATLAGRTIPQGQDGTEVAGTPGPTSEAVAA
jgi:hypothetical protein